MMIAMTDQFRITLKAAREGEESASAVLFGRYLEKLIRLARSRISPQLSRRIDPEDIVHSVYRSLFVRLRAGEYSLEESVDLWRLLVQMVQNKATRAGRYHSADKRSIHREVSTQNSFCFTSSEPPPDHVVIFNEELARLLGLVHGKNRQIVELRLQGYTQQEIAENLACDERTVRRCLVQIRKTLDGRFSTEIESGDASEKRADQVNIERVSDTRYLIQKFVGQGGFGRVYRAVDRVAGETVALKFLKKKYLLDEEMVTHFLEEAVTTSRIPESRVVPIYAVGETSTGHRFLVMKLVEGAALSVWTRDVKSHWIDVRRIVEELIDTLHLVHVAGVVHCDVKPDNIMIDESGEIWLTDFGLAKLQSDQTVSLAGTISYLAPEQIDPAFGPVSPRTDHYGVGLVLFELLTKEKFIQSDTLELQLREIVSERSTSEIRDRMLDGVPHDLMELCVSLLHRDPEKRPLQIRLTQD
jgi:eukaryotic-like serine/threonine-protein kinase